MDAPEVRCWHLGLPHQLRQGDGLVAFTASELDEATPGAAAAIGLHEAMAGSPPPAPRVEVHFPHYRPRSLVPVLAWLAARLGTSHAEVSWWLDKRQGPDSVRRLLEGLGWNLAKDRKGRAVRLHGTPPATASLPEPASFAARLGAYEVKLHADYGVFSPDHVDDGTALLLDVALRHRRVDTVADVGIGYGPLGIGLALNGVAQAVVGTDVDCLALWLARQNAEAHGVRLTLHCDADATSVPPTPLTVCNVPTHINAEQTAGLMRGLVRRAERGTLLVVVHASLEARYTRHLASTRLRLRRHPGPAHVVLEVTPPDR